MNTDRKEFLKQVSTGIAIGSLSDFLIPSEATGINSNDFTGDAEPGDEKYWNRIAKKYYSVSDDYINLENGYYGIQPKPVLKAYQRNIEYANEQHAKFARREYPAVLNAVKAQLASFLNVSDEEIIITRNATEALNIAIQGYPFRDGDEVILNQLDYFSMIETFRMLEQRGRIKVKAFDMPLLPSGEDEIVEIYRNQVTPKTRVILLTHVSNINGLIVPVAKIAAMAREKGIDTITDAAHALGQIPFSLAGLGSDFVGLNLHKWIGNPIGAGVLYVKKERIKELSPLFGDVNIAETRIGKLSHFGTTPFATIMTIPDSLAFQQLIGVEKLSARLHYLKSLWLDALNSTPNIEIITPGSNALSCGIAAFRVKNKTPVEVADYLFKDHKILTINRTLGTEGCVRVTPAIFNSAADVTKFVNAVKLLV
jgi:isopenicillin-N epimerase